MSRIILHLDMNSYFASVEQQANPHLRGRPVGVCEHLGGIIIAPSVEAKRLGIKLGTPVWEAIKIFPKIILLPADPPKYREVTDRFLKILSDYSDEVEQYSIDEAFVDMSLVSEGDYDTALLLGLQIKQRIKQEIGEWTSCSVGIGPNKLVAKIAADLGEGDIDRIAVVRPEDIPKLYDRLSLTDVPGIGPRLKRALCKLGIFTLRNLADYPLENLLNQFGILGEFLHRAANFRDDSPIVAADIEQEKSFGHAYTVPRALTDLGQIKKLILKLSEKVGRRMRRAGARGNTIHFFCSDRNHYGYSRQKKIKEYISGGQEIYKAALRIYQEGLRIKIMGVSVSGIIFDYHQEPLFEAYKKQEWLEDALDRINDKYGEFSIQRARLLGGDNAWAKDTIGFG